MSVQTDKLLLGCKLCITFTDVSCPSVKYIVNGSTGSLYQFGSGRVFCNVTIRTDPRLRVNLYAEFFNTGLSHLFCEIVSSMFSSFLPYLGVSCFKYEQTRYSCCEFLRWRGGLLCRYRLHIVATSIRRGIAFQQLLGFALPPSYSRDTF